MSALVSMYEKGDQKYPTIQLKSGNSRYGFTFGVAKAKLILDNVEDIKKFVSDNAKAA